MSGLGVNSVGTYQYTNNYLNSTQNKNKSASMDSFSDKIDEVASGGNSASTSSTRFEGNMVIPQPPNYGGYTYDNTISNKSKDEMTLDEYKQWFMNEMVQMPVSSWVRSSFSSGALVIKEEAFERMKNDTEYEKYVLNRVRSYYSASSGWSIGSNNVSYEVIGASPEECYGYAGPAGNSGSINSGDDESWWEKRNKRLKELLEEIEEKQLKRQQVEEQYIKQAYFNQQKLVSFLTSPSLKNGGNDDVLIQSMEVAATAYEKSSEIMANEKDLHV